MSKDTALGENKETGRTVYIDPKNRSTHMHIIGSTNEGKSKFMEHLIRQDIIEENGLCLIDPHGYLYEDLVCWCETKHMLDRTNPKKIILFDPSEAGWTFGFNPLKLSSSELSYHVDGMVKACAKVWGGEDTDRTPLLKRCLRILFHALAEKNLSLLEASYLINPTDGSVRQYLTQDIEDYTIRQEWDYFNTLKPKPFYDEFGSTINRMMEFLASPIIRNIIGQIESAIDFRKIMEEGYILLVNLAASDKISDDNARLLGALIVNDLFMKAKARPQGSRPFYLYIDECARFINEDIARILDEGRKFGLHLILAHQHLAQLKKAGEDVYQSVMTDAKAKVIFGGLSAEDAEVLVEQVFLGEIDLEEAKQSLNKPTVVSYVKTWLNNYSHSQGQSEGRGGGESRGSRNSTTRSLGTTYDSEGNIASTMTTQGSSSAIDRASNESWSWSNSWSSSEGASEALIPELEDRPTQVFSYEEQIYKAMALMVNQPQQHAIIKLPKQHTQIVKTPTVEPGYARTERIGKFKNKCYELADFANPRPLVERQLEERRLSLKQIVDKQELVRVEPKSFRE